jgi:hypothetical protein
VVLEDRRITMRKIEGSMGSARSDSSQSKAAGLREVELIVID